MGSKEVGVGEGSGALTRGGVPVLVLVVRVYLPDLGDGLLSLLVYLVLGRYALVFQAGTAENVSLS